MIKRTELIWIPLFGFFLGCLIPVNIAGLVDLGLCKDWRFTCQCGPHASHPVSLKLKQCTAFRGLRSHCKPCDELEPKMICPRFQHCLTCHNENMDRCASCPKNRYGTFCNDVCDCQNGGRCDAVGNCICTNRYEGLSCETPIGCEPPYAASPLIENRLPHENPLYIEYKCPPNQELIGVDRISCLSTRNWSHPPPTCRLTCSVPETPRNAIKNVERNPMLVGDIITFNCIDGFTMFGKDQLVCQENAILDGLSPHCEKLIECPAPLVVVEAVQTIDYPFEWVNTRYFNGTKINYKCAEDLFLQGNPTMTCLNNGRWSSEPPKCIKVPDVNVQCQTAGSELISDVGLLVRVHCPSGCAMTNDSVWGTVIYNELSSVCRSGVHSGKITNVGGTLYLSNSGSYSDFLGSTMNAVISENKLTTGQSFRFHVIKTEAKGTGEYPIKGCPDGWTETEGFCTYQAQKSKAWEMSKNICNNRGSKLPSIENQAFLKAMQKSSKGTFETWLLEKQKPSMELLDDSIVPDIENSTDLEPPFEESINEEELTECTVLLYQEGELVQKKRDCFESSSYYCVYPLVEEIEEQCDDPGPLDNGFATVEDTGFKLGSIIKYQCKELHYLTGSSTSVCTGNMTWSSPKPRCIKVPTCTAPLIPKYGLVEYLPPLQANANAARIAALRFRHARPGPVLRASRTGAVPGFNSTIANANNLEKPEKVEKGEPIAKNITLPPGHYRVGTRASYDCESRYYDRIGSQTRRCETDGSWSGRPATCLPICGRSDSPRTPFIVNGNSTDIGQWPWQIAISKYMDDFNTWFLLCGGALLSEQWIVTAAHCVTTSTGELSDLTAFRFHAGKYHRNNDLDDEMVQLRRAKEIHVHPYFDPVLYDADIALIQLDEPVELTTRVQPVCLPSERSTRQNIQDGKRGVVTGWGLTETDTYSEQLRQAVLPVVSHEKCESGYEKAGLPLTVSENMFCAGYSEGSSDACNGDSGGPVVFAEDSGQRRNWVLEGVVSWGSPTGCGNPEQYGGFTRVSKFLDWIYQFI